MRPLLPTLLLLGLALQPPAAARGEGEGEIPAYALPAGFSRGEELPAATRGTVERALEDITHPAAPWAAAEGWKVLAGIGRGAVPAATEALLRADWFGRSLIIRALGAMEDPALEPLLVQAAGDPAWAVRAAAAEGLGLSDGAPSAQVLPGLLSDGVWRVRQAAVEGVRRRALRGTLSRETAGGDLLPLAGDPDEDVRRAAWLALADLREPRARDPLLEALRRLAARLQSRSEADLPDPELSTAVRLLRGLAEGLGSDPTVLELLRDLGRAPEHALAGAALRAWFALQGSDGARDEVAVADLVGVFLARSADVDSRAAAEEAIHRVGEPAAATLLARISVPERPRRIDREYDIGTTREVLRVVLRIRGSRAAETLDRVLRDTSLSPVLRMHAAELGLRTCPAALGAVFRELLASREGSAGLDAQLLKGAAASGGDDLKGLLAAHLLRREGDRPPRHMRATAAEVLERRPDLRDAEVLRRALAAETDGDVIARLLPLIAEVEGEEARGTLERFLGDPRLRVRRAAVNGFSRLRGTAVVEILLAHLDREDGSDDRNPGHGDEEASPARREEMEAVRAANAGSLRGSVVTSLRMAAGVGARELLEGLLTRPDPAVRDAAAQSLSTLGDPASAAAMAEAVVAERDSSLRSKLLAVLAGLGGPMADAAFEGFLASENEDLRRDALDTLSGAGVKARAPRGLRARLEDPDADVLERLAALQALGSTADATAGPLLRARLAGAATAEERIAVLRAIGTSRDPGSTEAVAALLTREPPAGLSEEAFTTLSQAVETLGELRTPKAAGPLAALLARTLPGALSPGVGPAAGRDRQLASLCMTSLGLCGGDAALQTLVAAAFHPGFSRAAEAATANPLRRPLPRRDGDRWQAGVPMELRAVTSGLAIALARWKDGDLAPALDRRLAELRSDGRAFAQGEEWLVWLGENLATPPKKAPARPRWYAKVALARQVLLNPPRLTEADEAAAFVLWSHESMVSMEYAAAREDLGRWRDGMALHEPLRMERERLTFEGLDRVAAAAADLKAKKEGATAAPMLAAFEESGREDAVARLCVETLTDLGVHLDAAVTLGEGAVQSDASYAPNLRSLGAARYAAGNPEGAVEMFLLSLRESESTNYEREMQRATAGTRFQLGRALEACGERTGALQRLGEAARLSDVMLDWIDRDPGLAELRKDSRFAGAMEEGRKSFE